MIIKKIQLSPLSNTQNNSELKTITLCFTGHRSQKLPWRFNENNQRCLQMKQQLMFEIEKSIQQGYKIFMSGMALGFDMICAETVLKLKEKYKDIILVGALPCLNQDERWSADQKQRYRKLLKQLDKIRCEYKEYDSQCMIERNNYMVKNSSKMIALFDGQVGGTKNTINFAKKQGLDIVIITP